MSDLILLRHGQSQWNLENRFTGWVDVPLSPKGEDEARAAGEKLRGRRIDKLYTSVLQARDRHRDASRSRRPASRRRPTERDAALNERMYGDLQGLNKAEAAHAVRRRADQALAPELRRAAARAARASPTPRRASSPTGSRTSCPTCGPARTSWSPRTATRCAPSSCTSTASRREQVLELEIPDRRPAALRARAPTAACVGEALPLTRQPRGRPAAA